MAIIKCPNCGNNISDKSIKCIHCNYQLASLNANIDSQNTEKRKVKSKKKGWLFAAIPIAVFVMLVCSIITIIVLNKNGVSTSKVNDDNVKKVIQDIDSLGEVTADDKTKLSRVEMEYLQLSDEEKAQVTNFDKLEKAENKIAIAGAFEEADKYSAENSSNKKLENFKKVQNKYWSLSTKALDVSDRFTNITDASQVSYIYGYSQLDFIDIQSDLQDMYDQCGSDPQLKHLKSLVKDAKNTVPTRNYNSDAKGASDMLSDMASFLQNMVYVSEEMEKLEKKYK